MSAYARRKVAVLAAIAKDSPGLCPSLAAWEAWAENVPFEWVTQ